MKTYELKHVEITIVNNTTLQHVEVTIVNEKSAL